MSSENYAANSADLVVLNARIFTLDRHRPWANGFAVREGKFSVVGSDNDASAMVGPRTKIIDAKNHLIIPALIDSHSHAFEGARADLHEFRLSANDGFDDLLAAARRAVESSSRQWILGAGWSVPRLAAQLSEEPSLKLFDEATAGRPTVIRDSSYHAMFANSAAMRLANVQQGTTYDGKGSIVRYGDGRPSGLFLENACALVQDHVPQLSQAEKREIAKHAVRLFNSFGVTGFVHAVTSESTIKTFKELDDDDELRAWVATCIATDSILASDHDGIGDALIAKRGAYRSKHIAVDFVKYFMDGVPGARTAAFFEPFVAGSANLPDRAEPSFKVAELRDLIAAHDARGIHVKVHAVGDRAISDTLDAIEEVRRLNGRAGPQHSIAHLSYIRPKDIPRLAKLNIVADFCPPLWFPNPILDGNAIVLGAARAAKAWPIGDIVRSGALSLLGTDWPIVPSPNPWPGLAAAITRKNPSGRAAGVFRPEQALSLEQALPLCTINVAESMGFGGQTGSISAGKFADFIMLDRNLFDIPREQIAETRVLQTYFAGKLAYEA